MLSHKSNIQITREDVIHWRHAHGNEVDGSKYDDILGSYDGQIPASLATGLFKGITEAMTNCHHHAYLDERDDGTGIRDAYKNWWMFSQKKDGYLYVDFCDLGIGIPRSLPTKRPALWRQIISLGKAKQDGAIIKEAIDDSKTRTGMSHRGKGLNQLVEAIGQIPGASMMILSNKGCYALEHGKQPLVLEYNKSILGTLIAWKIPIDEHTLMGIA